MPDPQEGKTVLRLDCPCCGARLEVDAARGEVVKAEEPASAARKAADLKEAQRLLAEESSRIEEKYRKIVENDKGRGAAMDKLFKSFMEKAKDEPVEKPVKDIDLD
ncbi:MAG TPA: hypothetical protein VIU29_11225 [Candidatus Deferrimicrobiaceae bacterium]